MRKTKQWIFASVLCIGVCLLSVLGIRLYNSLSADAAEGGTVGVAPTISLDWDSYTSATIPKACVDKEYRIFSAKATTYKGENIDVNTRVYLYYYSETASRINVKAQKFVPKQYGVYTVEYSATDENGTSVFTYDVVCEEKEPLKATLGDGERTGVCGSIVSVAELSLDNANGKAGYIASARLDGKDVVYEIADGMFVPLYAGKYIVEYDYFDYNESGTVSYEISVSAIDAPVVMSEATFPKYWIAGYEYALPQMTCYDFASGEPVDVEPNVEVVEADEKKYEVSTSAFSYTPKTEGAASITYSFAANGKTVKRSFIVRVVDVRFTGEMAVEKYFYSEQVSAVAESDHVALSAKSNGKVEFINALLSNVVKTRLAFDGNYANFEKLNIYFTDSQDETQSVKITLRKGEDGKATLLVNDNETAAVKTSVSFLSGATFELNLNETNRILSVGNDVALEIRKYTSGKAFEGFSSEKVYLSYAFENVSGESRVCVDRIGNQSIYRSYGDGVAPDTLFSTYSHGVHKLGDTVTLERIYVGDVLCPEFTIDYGVLQPNGEYLVLNEGIDWRKPYSFKAEQLGKYNVYIRAVDCFGNESVFSYAVTVADDSAPTIAIHGTNKTEYKLGSVVSFAKATATDNLDGEVDVFVYVVAPNLQVTQASDSYSVKRKGKYTVIYYAFDSSGNVARITNTFYVN